MSANTWTCTACGTVHPIDHTGMWCGTCRAIVLCAGCEGQEHVCAVPSKDAAELAFDEITKLCGCKTWEYPGQVVRDVQLVIQQRDDARKQLERAVRYNEQRGKGGQHVGPTHEFAAATPSTLSRLHRWARELTMAASGAEVSLATKEPT